MHSYLKENPVSVVMGALFVLCFGVTTFFLMSANADLRQENRAYKDNIKALEKENDRKQLSIDSLKASVTQRDIQDSLFKAQITQLDITTTNANHRTIINMPVDSFMQLFSAYIDSAGKATN